MKYDVWIYPVVRVKVTGIEAENQCDAIEQACEACDLDTLLNHPEYEYADEISYFFVDEEGDSEYINSRWHDGIDCSVMEGSKR